MQKYDVFTFFKEPEVDTTALTNFLQKFGLHMHYAVPTHFRLGKGSAIKYLESIA